MAQFAVVQDGLVINVIVADSLEIAQQFTNSVCVEYTNESPAAIGDKFEETPVPPVK